MTRAELIERFQQIASEVAEKPIALKSESTPIADLGIDSLGMLEIVGAMERKLKIQIPDESLAGLQTVKDLLEAVEKRISASA